MRISYISITILLYPLIGLQLRKLLYKSQLRTKIRGENKKIQFVFSIVLTISPSSPYQLRWISRKGLAFNIDSGGEEIIDAVRYIAEVYEGLQMFMAYQLYFDKTKRWLLTNFAGYIAASLDVICVIMWIFCPWRL